MTNENKVTQDAIARLQSTCGEFGMAIHHAIVDGTGIPDGCAFALVFQLPNGQFSMQSNLKPDDAVHMLAHVLKTHTTVGPEASAVVTVNPN